MQTRITAGFHNDEIVFTLQVGGEVWTAWRDEHGLECSSTVRDTVIDGPALIPTTDLYIEILDLVERTIQLREVAR